MRFRISAPTCVTSFSVGRCQYSSTRQGSRRARKADGIMSAERLIGIISDTHGLLRPEAIDALRGIELILHGGDIGKAEVLTELAKIAPVLAVRGNNDTEAWAEAIPETQTIEIGGVGPRAIMAKEVLILLAKARGAGLLELSEIIGIDTSTV